MKPTRRKSKFAVQEDSDPLSVVVNLFDVAMVFAVALMVAMVMHMNMTEVFTQEDFTVVTEHLLGILFRHSPAAHQPPGVALRLFGAGAEAHQRRERLVGRFVAFFPYFSRVHTMRGFPKRSSRTSVSVYPSAPRMRTISAAARS